MPYRSKQIAVPGLSGGTVATGFLSGVLNRFTQLYDVGQQRKFEMQRLEQAQAPQRAQLELYREKFDYDKEKDRLNQEYAQQLAVIEAQRKQDEIAREQKKWEEEQALRREEIAGREKRARISAAGKPPPPEPKLSEKVMGILGDITTKALVGKKETKRGKPKSVVDSLAPTKIEKQIREFGVLSADKDEFFNRHPDSPKWGKIFARYLEAIDKEPGSEAVDLRTLEKNAQLPGYVNNAMHETAGLLNQMGVGGSQEPFLPGVYYKEVFPGAQVDDQQILSVQDIVWDLLNQDIWGQEGLDLVYQVIRKAADAAGIPFEEERRLTIQKKAAAERLLGQERFKTPGGI
jgi:hypothetical protein